MTTHSAAPEDNPLNYPAESRSVRLYIGGKSRSGGSGERLTIKNPRGEDYYTLTPASIDDVTDAVTAARAVQNTWAQHSGYERGESLLRVATLLQERKNLISESIRRYDDVSQAVAENAADNLIDRWIWWTGWADKLTHLGNSSSFSEGTSLRVVTHEPLGVVLLVQPPGPALPGIADSLLPALLAGNTVILLSSVEQVSSSLVLPDVLALSDIPSGAINLLFGDVAELSLRCAGRHKVDAIDIVRSIHDDTGHPLKHSLDALAAGSRTVIIDSNAVAPTSTEGAPFSTTSTIPKFGPDPRVIQSFTQTKIIHFPCGR